MSQHHNIQVCYKTETGCQFVSTGNAIHHNSNLISSRTACIASLNVPTCSLSKPEVYSK